jgi:hypothetical protein
MRSEDNIIEEFLDNLDKEWARIFLCLSA